MRISDWSSDVCASVLTARAGRIGSTAAEALLHASQETRTYGESAANISMTTFLGGLVGAGAGALANPLSRRVEADLTVPVDPRADPYRPGFVTLTEEDLKLDTAEASADLIQGVLDDPTVPPARGLGAEGIEFNDRAIDDLPPIELPARIGQGGPVGAMAVSPSDEQLKSALGVERVTRWRSPMPRPRP